MSDHRTVQVYMVAAGQYHDIDFARLELLKLLAEDEKVRVRVAADYHDIEAILASDVLITYTCNLVPTEAEQVALRDFVANGGDDGASAGMNRARNHLFVERPQIFQRTATTGEQQYVAFSSRIGSFYCRDNLLCRSFALDLGWIDDYRNAWKTPP